MTMIVVFISLTFFGLWGVKDFHILTAELKILGLSFARYSSLVPQNSQMDDLKNKEVQTKNVKM